MENKACTVSIFSGMFLGMFLIAALSVSASGSIIISQVLYDPVNESGGEAVEIYNPTGSPVNVGGWTLATEASQSDVTLPSVSIQPGRYFLIADVGWSPASGVIADYEEAMTLANSDAGVALMWNGTIVDAVGWGNELNIGAGLFEGSAAGSVGEGYSLVRKGNQDTGNSSDDFVSALPSFRNSSFTTGNVIDVHAIVFGSSPFLSNISIVDDDLVAAGFQVMPFPGQNRSFRVSAVVSDSSGEGDIASVHASFLGVDYIMSRVSTINSTSALYEANISFPFYEVPGNKSVTVQAADNAGMAGNLSLSVDVMAALAMEVDVGSVIFSSLPGGYSEVMGDTNMASRDMGTVRNVGNTVLNIQLSGTDLSYGSSVIGASNLKFSFDGNFSSNVSGQIGSVRQRAAIGLAPGTSSLAQFSLRLDVPQGTSVGNYTGKIFLDAVS